MSHSHHIISYHYLTTASHQDTNTAIMLAIGPHDGNVMSCLVMPMSTMSCCISALASLTCVVVCFVCSLRLSQQHAQHRSPVHPPPLPLHLAHQHRLHLSHTGHRLYLCMGWVRHHICGGDMQCDHVDGGSEEGGGEMEMERDDQTKDE